MNRRRRTEILIQDKGNLAEKFAEAILTTYEYREITAPHYGLTMIKVRETAKNSLFYIGEVLVTEAKMEINNCIGTGIVAGMEEKLAKQLALIDAAYKAELSETILWESQLIAAECEIRNAKAKEQAELVSTKVNFETMEI
ncbi:phosphonate C-P lyase system protein PhnG [Sporosarcina sp. P13]|uniref:phosphonate C-P lyase system protein PhnG n=1 Tax=Sporosarcina sp. P13 TaxID=2048263 RepID=UPI000C1664C2|nr:phosphonate C-P lyase system protein PhnG [Sporosarcina sp. P13]PIC64135.1 phosphonate C-P lyase system protein PhnG [Sporosarcina sp. P13]